MFSYNILEIVPVKVLNDLSKHLTKYYPVHKKRIYELIVQVNSVDVAIELLNNHLTLDATLDNILMQYLKGRDNTNGKEREDFDRRFNKGKFEAFFR